MSSSRGLCVVLLAAGRGRRFNEASATPTNKLLQALPDGRAVAVAAAQSLQAALRDTMDHAAADWLAVVRPGADAATARLRLTLTACGWRVIVANDADAGMGHSLAAGVRATPHAAGWLIALADMPHVRPQTIRRITGRPHDPRSLIAPRHLGRRGHPVLFGSSYFNELTALRGDAGARDILQRHADALTLVEVDDPGVLRDVDTPADLRG